MVRFRGKNDHVFPSLISLIGGLWRHITPKRQKQFGLVLLLMVASAFFEVISLGAVIPFLGALISPQKIYFHSHLSEFFQKIGSVESRRPERGN